MDVRSAEQVQMEPESLWLRPADAAFFPDHTAAIILLVNAVSSRIAFAIRHSSSAGNHTGYVHQYEQKYKMEILTLKILMKICATWNADTAKYSALRFNTLTTVVVMYFYIILHAGGWT